MSTAKPVLVGQIAGAFGVRGEVKITTYTEDSLALARYRVLQRENGAHALTILAARVSKSGIIARTSEVTSKEAADALRGLKLYVSRDVLPPVEDEDEFYLTDLIGLHVESSAGDRLGTIKAMHNFGAGDVVELDPGGGRATAFYAFTRESFPEVKLTERYVVLVPPVEDSAQAADADPG